MAAYTKYKNLEKPTSVEKYNIGVANKNNDVIDSELHRLDLKNESQDALLATKESLSRHENDTENPHNVSKAQIGLSNVDNTADADKPVSAAQREAINDIYVQTNSYVDMKIANVVDGAPETLDTLKKLADALDEKHGESIGEILKNIQEIKENTDENNLVSAVVIGELIDDLNSQPQFVYDENGKITGYKSKAGADTVFPFSANPAMIKISGALISTLQPNSAGAHLINISFNMAFTVPFSGSQILVQENAYNRYASIRCVVYSISVVDQKQVLAEFESETPLAIVYNDKILKNSAFEEMETALKAEF